jgi:lipopolysaccharide export system permease protein
MSLGRRGSLSLIRRYAGREFLFAFLVAFLFFFVVFFVNQLLLMAEDILSKKAPLRSVILLLLYAMPSVVAISFPFGALLGALMAVGRLAAENELLVLQSSGIPLGKVFRPFLVLGLLFSVASFAMNDYFLPLGTIQFGKLYRQLVISSPALELRPWSSRRFADATIVTGAIDGATVRELLIFDRDEENRTRVISAKAARLEPSADGNSIQLYLEGVWTQTVAADKPDRFEWSSCDSMEYRLESPERGSINTSIGPREMSSRDLASVLDAKEAAEGERLAKRRGEAARQRAILAEDYARLFSSGASWGSASRAFSPLVSQVKESSKPVDPDRSLQVYRLEYYKKFSIPFGSLCFVVFAFPVGARVRRAGRSVGLGIGLLMSVLYWALLLGGQTLGTRLGWSPFWSMWLPNTLVLAAGLLLWLFQRLGR